MKRFLCCLFLLALAACSPQLPATPETPSVGSSLSGPQADVPDFEHIVLVVFENKSFDTVIGNPMMPTLNRLASENTLLTTYYATRNPSLPNYIALVGGDTFGIETDCIDCFVDAPGLPDLIEASGRTWKTYQESMPEPCFLGDVLLYRQKHNPFIYFDSIRDNHTRCEESVVPLTALRTDIEAKSLPNFIFITPNMCHDSHNCPLIVADSWLDNLLRTLNPALEATRQPYLIVVMFEESRKGDPVCCGLPEPGGGHVPVILLSPQAKANFEDSTPYTHYSLLKTISEAWNLPYLGHAADENITVITAPWK
jgi:acid phosphatase